MKARTDKTSTKGNKVIIDFGTGSKPTCPAGGQKRHLIEAAYDGATDFGTVMVNGLIRFADGTEAFALLEIDESSSGEHGGTGIFTEDGFTWQDDPDFLKQIGKTKGQVFPYRYKYTGEVRANSDHHIGSDGWSK